jgi:large subunit ribosomal protein L13
MLNNKIVLVDTLSYKTISANKATVNKEWVLIDAENMVLGRLASEVAKILRGKHKPEFTPHVDCGDNVIVINAEKVQLTGKKLTDRIYLRHSGYPGGQRTQTPKGMLPKNKLGRQLFRNLHVVVGSEHKHQAQKPKVIDLSTNN